MKKLLLILSVLLISACNNGDLQPAFFPDSHFTMPTGDVHHVHKPTPVDQILFWDKLASDFYNEAEV